jgi:hypothetical protein
MLPNSEVPFANKWNKKLKKLTSSYMVISYCYVPEDPYSVCYIGKDTAVAGLSGKSIQYVNVSGKINLRQLMTLDHECFDIACHGDTLYVSSGDTIYKYDKNCKQKEALYHYPDIIDLSSIAISDNGERLYLMANTDVTTIDDKGNHLFNEQFDGYYSLCDICIAGEGIVLVLVANNNVHQLDYNGKKYRTVDSMPLNISFPQSMCFDRERCTLIVDGREDKIYVYKLRVLVKLVNNIVLVNQEPNEKCITYLLLFI